MVFDKVKRLWFKLLKKEMDPVKILPEKAMEQIFSHLRGRELLELALVSKGWNKFIGKSPVCMDKIKIHITEYFFSQRKSLRQADVLRMLENGRQYRNLSIACLGSFNQLQRFSPEHKLLIALFRWKSVSLYNHWFDDEMEFVNFLGQLEPFVEEIELRTVKIQNFIGICETNFEFPKLKVLRLVNVGNFVYREPFKSVCNLKEFTVATEAFRPVYNDHPEEVHERVQSLTRILLNNRSIESLELFIDQKDFDCMFVRRDFILEIGFKLKTLRIGRFKMLLHERQNHFQVKNFIKFIRRHARTLKDFYLLECLGMEVLETAINEMEALKVLTIHEIESYAAPGTSHIDSKLLPNESIESLNLISKRFTDLVTAVLTNLPNLRRLSIGTINQQLLTTLAERTQKLESITADYFTPTTLPTHPILPNLKHLSIAIRGPENFKELIEAKGELTSFEKVYLRSTKSLLQRRWNVSRKNFYQWI